MSSHMDREKRRAEFMASVKPGDFVGQFEPFSRKAIAVKVDRVTPTLIIIGHRRYAKKDGYAIGQHASFSRPNIVEITDDVREQIEHNTLLQWFGSRNWNTATIDQLRAMKKAHDEAAASPSTPSQKAEA